MSQRIVGARVGALRGVEQLGELLVESRPAVLTALNAAE